MQYWICEIKEFSIYIAAGDQLTADKEVREYIHSYLSGQLGDDPDPKLFPIESADYWHHYKQPVNDHIIVLYAK